VDCSHLTAERAEQTAGRSGSAMVDGDERAGLVGDAAHVTCSICYHYQASRKGTEHHADLNFQT
jgi:hypothetical protein